MIYASDGIWKTVFLFARPGGEGGGGRRAAGDGAAETGGVSDANARRREHSATCLLIKSSA